MKCIIAIGLGVFVLLTSVAEAQEVQKFRGERFELQVPAALTIVEKPPTDQAMQALSQPGATDSRGLGYQIGLIVVAKPNANPDRKPVSDGKQEMLETLQRSHNVNEGPTLETIDIPGCDGALLLTVRTREQGKQIWRLNLSINKGTDVYEVNGMIVAYAGSEITSSKGESFKSLRDAIASFRFAQRPTSQPATTKSAG